MEKQYFTTGEFAKLCNISKQTLIFYDKTGVFSPEYKDNNNYRYYSIHQYDTIDILISLRDIGMSLDEIKEYIQDKDPKLCVKMLQEENERIKEKIKKLKKISSKIQNKIEITEEGLANKDNVNIYEKEENEEYLIISDTKGIEDVNDFIMQIIEFTNYFSSKNLYEGYEIGAMVSKENLEKKRYLNYENIYIKVNKKTKNKRLYIKPQGKYVCINHKGKYEETYKSYEKLVKYINENNYKIIGNSYEKSMLDFFSVQNEDDYLTQISIQVK